MKGGAPTNGRGLRQFVLAAVAAVAAAGGCDTGREEKKTAPAVQGQLEVFGSSTAVPIVSRMAEGFAREHPAVTLDIKESTSSWGIGYLRQGMTDVAMSTRRLAESESDLVARPIARDGLCMLLHAENPVAALTDEQIAGIFTGKITNWKDVGGEDAEIVRINHAEVRTTLGLFTDYLKLEPSAIKYTDIVISSDKEAVKHVSSKPTAVTYTSIAIALTAAAGGSPLKLVGFGGVPPTVENVRDGKVPIVYDVTLVTKGPPEGAAKAFIDYVSSAERRPIAEENNFAPRKG